MSRRSPSLISVVPARSARPRRATSPKTSWSSPPRTARTDQVLALTAGLDSEHDAVDARDLALILIGYAAALRRTDLARLTSAWLEVSAHLHRGVGVAVGHVLGGHDMPGRTSADHVVQEGERRRAGSESGSGAMLPSS